MAQKKKVSASGDGWSVSPYATSESKKIQVQKMFDAIARRYDFLNHFLSLGIDRRWRNIAACALREHPGTRILDVATGTGDFAFTLCRYTRAFVTGLDISENMLRVGREKVQKSGLSDRITLVRGDSESLPFSDNQFDAATSAFGVRNFENLTLGLREMFRVLKPGGKVVILEFSDPEGGIFRPVFKGYFRFVLPIVARLFTPDKHAYRYLQESASRFPSGKAFCDILLECGYAEVRQRRLTFGVASVYTAVKSKSVRSKQRIQHTP